MKQIVMVAVLAALAVSARAQDNERILPNTGSVEDRTAAEPTIRAAKARALDLPVQLTGPASLKKALATQSVPNPAPTPPAPGVTVTGVLVDPEGTPIVEAYVLVSSFDPWGNRNYFPTAWSDETGTFIAPCGEVEPPMGTELLVQAIRYPQSPGETGYLVNTRTVEVTGSLNNAGRFTIVHQMSDVWLEAFATGNEVFLRVRHGNSYPGRDLITLVTASTGARTALFRTDAQDQKPYITRRYWWYDFTPRVPLMHFSIPARVPAVGGTCGNVQISSEKDPSLVWSSEHGFCYNPVTRSLWTW